jgi:hypothetical protein
MLRLTAHELACPHDAIEVASQEGDPSAFDGDIGRCSHSDAASAPSAPAVGAAAPADRPPSIRHFGGIAQMINRDKTS